MKSSFMRHFIQKSALCLLGCMLMLLTGCDAGRVIINSVDEREANEIVVLLATKGVKAEKVGHSTATASGEAVMRFDISVGENEATYAMAFLNQSGFPRMPGTSLLNLFAKQGLMSSQQEENIRYQAGLAEQIASTIRLIDGVIDAQVQIAFPSSEAPIGSNAPPQKTTASVYVKHQGVFDDPNSFLVTKIKRLVASSVNGLDINDVTVIADRARFMEVTLDGMPQVTAHGSEYVSIWSIVMSKASAPTFRLIFFGLMFACSVLLFGLGWMFWKFYPILRKTGGLKQLLQVAPIAFEEPSKPSENAGSQEQPFP